MSRRTLLLEMSGLSFSIWLLVASTVSAQTFTSGSTGADGAFTPTCAPTPCTVAVPLPASGVFNYTTVTIPAGVTVTYTKNAANTPVTILATGDVTINGTLNLDGEKGKIATTGLAPTPPGEGGPGGFRGGHGAAVSGQIPPGNGQGPGGAVFIPGQGSSGLFPVDSGVVGTYGASMSFVSLLPLFGGSGGSGSVVVSSTQAGYSGAGGGGALAMASSTKITLAAGSLITARGGDGPILGQFFCGLDGGAGSGGAIRLVAPLITGTGALRVTGGGVQCAAIGGAGRLRVEAFSFTGFAPTISPPTNQFAYSQVFTPGPVTAASNPALINLPTLTISSVGGVATPTVPMASYDTADISLPQGSPSTVPATVTATNTPIGTAFRLRVIPRNGGVTTVDTGASAGTFASSTATAMVNLPTGQVVVLNADAAFTLPQLASLFPDIDGEPVERIMVAAAYGESSTMSLATKSGKQVPVAQLPLVDQLRIATAWEEAMQTSRQ